VICPDVAGRGGSAWLGSPLAYNFPQFLADIRSLLVHARVKELAWIGTSMGGLLGLLLASQPASPVRRLVMNDVGAFVPMQALRRIARNLDAPERFDSRAQLEAHLRRAHRDWGAITEAQWSHLVRHGARRVNGAWRLHYDPQIAHLMQAPAFAPGLYFWDAWYRVRCPVLVVRGERSEVLPASVASTMRDVKPQAEVVEIAGAGHAPALMSAEEIALVREFVRGVDAPGARPNSPRATWS